MAALAQAVAAKGPGSSLTCPTFDAANFPHPTTITNQYFPLTRGNVFTYEGSIKKQSKVETITVTRSTPTVDGISVVEVRDQESDGGTPVEDTRDWFAHDVSGNASDMREATTPLPAGPHDGSWTAGVAGAPPGLTMEAPPQVGDTYRQEHAPGVAQDVGQVVGLSAPR